MKDLLGLTKAQVDWQQLGLCGAVVIHQKKKRGLGFPELPRLQAARRAAALAVLFPPVWLVP